MRRIVQRILLETYRVIFARGLLRFAWGRRLFFGLYETYKRGFEASGIDGLRRFVREGSSVIDVGANVGFFTERFARWVGPRGRVIAIEPEARNHAELVRRLAARGLDGCVRAVLAAADAKSGAALLMINPDHPGDHRLADEGDPVRTVTLDDLTAPDQDISLVKIDVQGAEMRVLAGASAILARERPALFVEVDPAGLARFGGGPGALMDSLTPLGYTPYRLTRSGPKPLPRAELDRLLKRYGYTDVLFLADATSAKIAA